VLNVLAIMSSSGLVGNAISDEEKKWMDQIEAAAKAEGLTVDNRYMLASFAIVAKGDVSKAIKRIKNWNTICDTHRVKDVTEEQATAWIKGTMPELFYATGRDDEGRTGNGIRQGKIQPKKVESAEDVRMFVRVLGDNLRANACTLEEVRRGSFFMGDMSEMKWENFSFKLQKKIAGVIQDGYPIKLKRIILVNPPSFFFALLKLLALVMKKKIIDRIKPIQMSEVPTLLTDPNSIPAHMGGGMTQDFYEKRANQLKIWRASVAELEGGGGPRASTVSM